MFRETRRLHIIAHGRKWAVKQEGNTRASVIYTREEDAIMYAITKTHKRNEIVIHNIDGTVRKWLVVSD